MERDPGECHENETDDGGWYRNQATKDLVYDRTLRAKESIQGHPLDYKQAMATFLAKAVGNFRYLAVITPWRQRELDRLDRYW